METLHFAGGFMMGAILAVCIMGFLIMSFETD